MTYLYLNTVNIMEKKPLLINVKALQQSVASESLQVCRKIFRCCMPTVCLWVIPGKNIYFLSYHPHHKHVGFQLNQSVSWCGQQHRSPSGDGLLTVPFHSVHIGFLVKLSLMPPVETLRWVCSGWVYQGWIRQWTGLEDQHRRCVQERDELILLPEVASILSCLKQDVVDLLPACGREWINKLIHKAGKILGPGQEVSEQSGLHHEESITPITRHCGAIEELFF